MSQSNESTSRKPRRAARVQRQRPLLVTSTADEQTPALQQTQDQAESVSPLEEPTSPPPPKVRRLPRFFSTIGHKEQETPSDEQEVHQARLARATRKKMPIATRQQSTAQGDAAPAEKSAPRASSTRPTSTFKTRYIVGMALYLVAANVIGIWETQFLQSIHANQTLARFTLFGGQIVISTSSLVFLATLVIILVLLARFDLIPRSLSTAGTTSNRTTNKTGRATTQGSRATPPSMRQGVQGADDKLYQAYRTQQRREKKR